MTRTATTRRFDLQESLFALAFAATFGAGTAYGQAARKPAAPAPQPAASQAPAQAEPLNLGITRIPVNPTDPIAIVNNQVITRMQLADECVARKGEEILETLIARTLIEQALRAKKLEITAAEIDKEIDNVAMRVAGIGREAWLRTLDKERGISPVQYARDIIYPALALRKLSTGMVQVTEKDQSEAFEAQYGEKLRCRMIMVDKVQKAKDLWEELRKNPGGFEKLAMENSMDSGSRSLGGLLGEPISRHSYPQNVSDAAFRQLVDGDPADKDAAHKPKDGDFTGPIQVADATWILLRREGIIPAQKVDKNDPSVKKNTYEMIYEVKLKDAMSVYMNKLLEAATVENKLTGHTKPANQSLDVDAKVELTGSNGASAAASQSSKPAGAPAGATSTSPNVKVPTPAGLSSDVVKQTEAMTQPSTKK
jgi:foldase protein PrsA